MPEFEFQIGREYTGTEWARVSIEAKTLEEATQQLNNALTTYNDAFTLADFTSEDYDLIEQAVSESNQGDNLDNTPWSIDQYIEPYHPKP